MKVLLINPSVGYYTRALSNPLGLLSIGTYLKQHGHEVRIYDRCVEKTKYKNLISEFKPDIVGVSVMSSRGLKDAIKISKYIKGLGIKVVWGGQLPSMQTDLVINSGYVDIISFGEGEETWKELLECFDNNGDLKNILGIIYKDGNGKIIYNPCRPFSDLRDMPVSDWSLLDATKYMQTYLGCQKMMYIYSSKGCPGRCAFCSNVNFHKSTHRKRPNEYVIEEIKYLIDNHGLDGVYFSDELWCLKKEDALDFCRRVRDNNLNFHWGVQLRIGMFDEETYQAMYDAGCRWVFYGIESGSREMQKRIHKNINYDKIKPTFDMLSKMGYMTIGSFIVGFPDETESELQESVNLIKEIGANFATIYHFTPMFGTELYDQVTASGRYKKPEKLEDLLKVVATENIGVNLSQVPDKDLRVIRSYFHWKSFSDKGALNNGKAFDFAKQTILSGLHSIAMKGPISFFIDGFTALYEFLYVLWYAHAYPDVIKKYNLKD